VAGAADIAVLTSDEGLNGLGTHPVNDTDAVVRGRPVVELSTVQHRVEEAGSAVEVPSRAGSSCPATPSSTDSAT
jgi:hypothetical protein